jgi:hypothetical protein
MGCGHLRHRPRRPRAHAGVGRRLGHRRSLRRLRGRDRPATPGRRRPPGRLRPPRPGAAPRGPWAAAGPPSTTRTAWDGPGRWPGWASPPSASGSSRGWRSRRPAGPRPRLGGPRRRRRRPGGRDPRPRPSHHPLSDRINQVGAVLPLTATYGGGPEDAVAVAVVLALSETGPGVLLGALCAVREGRVPIGHGASGQLARRPPRPPRRWLPPGSPVEPAHGSP